MVCEICSVEGCTGIRGVHACRVEGVFAVEAAVKECGVGLPSRHGYRSAGCESTKQTWVQECWL